LPKLKQAKEGGDIRVSVCLQVEDGTRDELKDLAHLVHTHALKKEKRLLSSGKMSDFYFDCKAITLSPDGAYLAAKAMLDKIDLFNTDAIGGLELGATPLVGAMAVLCRKFPVTFFIVRKMAKTHGERKLIEGPGLRPGARVVVIDDVVTSGMSVMQAVDAVWAQGANVTKVVVLVDRKEGGSQFLAHQGIPLESVFTAKDFGIGNS
jgi:orotate phosphoribosyltransferase